MALNPMYSPGTVSYCRDPAGHRARGYYGLGPDGSLECGYCLVEAQRRGLAPMKTGSSPGGTGSDNDLLSSQPPASPPIIERDPVHASFGHPTSRRPSRPSPPRPPRAPRYDTSGPPIGEGRHLRRCAYCQREFRAERSDKRFCQETHRRMAFDKRKREQARYRLADPSATTQPQGTEP